MKNKPLHYILDDNFKPVPLDVDEDWDMARGLKAIDDKPPDWFLRWANFMEHGHRTVGLHEFDYQGTLVRISTCFLGMDHRRGGKGPPILWETMIFWPGNEELNQQLWRYDNYEQAQAGHLRAVDMVTGKLP